LPMDHARSAVRFSLGKQTTANEIKNAGDAIAQIVERLTQAKSSAYVVA
jgi:cysteine sulfinate desulfinase/cysteine desulfurase-like protein